MAGNAVIGALRVVLGADTAELETGLKRAQSQVSGFGSGFAKVAVAVAAAAATIAGSMAVAIKSSINDLDRMTKSAQKIGVPVEELVALRHAGDLAGVSMEGLEKGIARLARNTVEAGQGLSTPIRAFEALGIGIHNSEGKIKSVGDLLPELAEKFSQMPDGPVKTALAMQLLGRAGADLIPLLNAGAGGLKEMMDEARALGLVFSTETGQQAELFNDNLTRLHRVITGVITQVTANVLPALARFSQFMIDGAKNSGFLQAATAVLTTAFNGIARAAIVVYDNIGLVVKIGALFVAAKMGAAAISVGLAFVKLSVATRTLGLTMAAFNVIRGISMRGILLMAGIAALAAGAFDGFGAKIKEIGASIAAMLPEGAGEQASELFKSMGLNLEGLTADLESWKGVAGKDGGGLFNPDIINNTKNALQSFIDGKEKHIAVMQAEAAVMGQSSLEMERAKIVAEALAVAKTNNIPVTAALRQKIEELAASTSKWNLIASYGKQVFEQTRTPLEQYRAEIERLNIAFENGARDPETYARAVAQAQDRMVQANPHAQNLGNSLESAFDRAIESGAKLGDVLKSLIQDFIKMEARTAFKSLLYGNTGYGGSSSGILASLIGGFGKILGGGGAVSGMDMEFKLPGFATGGSFKIGGSGPSDSKLVQFFGTPGEMVNVSKPGQAGYAGGTQRIQVDIFTSQDLTAVAREAGRSGGVEAADLRVQTFSNKELPYRLREIERNPRKVGV